MSTPSPKPDPSADSFEFGPFRLEVSTQSLFQGQEFVPTTPKAFDTLRVLVEHAGRVISDRELLERVWRNALTDEASIANNISALRKILNPHFHGHGPIVTIARRGYCFTAPVQRRNQRAKMGAEAGAIDLAAMEEAAARFRALGDTPSGRLVKQVSVNVDQLLSSTRVVAIASIALAIVVGIAMITAMRVSTAAPVDARVMRRAVAVMSIENLSGRSEHAWFSTALAEALNTQLNAGGQLRLVSGQAVTELEKDLGARPGAKLSRKELDHIGSSLGCDLILTGTYLHTNGRVRVDLRLDDIAIGAPVASVSVEDAENKLVDLVTSATRSLRTTIGLAPPLPGEAEAARASLSSNPNALRNYFLGLEALRNHEIPRATELLTQAITDDPAFALAYSVLSTSWRVIGHDQKSEVAAKHAFEHSSRLGREDQLLVEGAYYAVMGDVPSSIEKFQALWNFFPDNISYGIRLAHQQLLGGRLDDARRTIDQLRGLLPPADGDPRVDVVESNWYFRKSQYADALRVATAGAEKARRRSSNQLLAILTMTKGNQAHRLGDLDNARSYYAEAQALYDDLGDVGGVAEVMRSDAALLLERRQLQEAEQRLNDAADMVAKIGYQRMLTEIRITRAEVAIELGKLALAKSDAEAALSSARAVNNRSAMVRALTELGRVVALRGDGKTARAQFEEAERVAREIGEPALTKVAADNLASLR